MHFRPLRAAAFALTSLLAITLSACGSPAGSTGPGDGGDPVSGGTLRVAAMSEPLHLRPMINTNSWGAAPIAMNSLFGTLLQTDSATGEVKPGLATLNTSDGGKTYELVLTPDMTFTDGTPFDAAAVKANWQAVSDPAIRAYARDVVQSIETMEVVNPTVLRLDMVSPWPNFGAAIVGLGMNWIASPTALAKGDADFDQNPVGAGPFMLQSWTRGGQMVLKKNPDYVKAAEVHLDGVTLMPVMDGDQSLNLVQSGGVDLSVQASPQILARAGSSGLTIDIQPLSGAQNFIFNAKKGPFTDIRAREAVVKAIDRDALNQAATQGTGEVPQSYLTSSSPLYTDIPLQTYDKDVAQKLFDELAAEGKPVSFTLITTTDAATKSAAEAIQAQLSTYRNVTASVRATDYNTYLTQQGTGDFDLIVYATYGIDPARDLYRPFYSTSVANKSFVSSPELDQFLSTAIVASSTEERKSAVAGALTEMAKLYPAIWYLRATPGLITGPKVHGVFQIGTGSAVVENAWIS